MKSASRADITDLQHIPNIGPSIAANLRRIGITSPHELLGKDPYVLYEELCHATGT
jgi:predicted flap endonuclease-1-like 5' DNA nuclease